jgi:plasmid stabilization system protein ParE
MKYHVKRRARDDLKAHWHYIAEHDFAAANRLLDSAEETFKLIA